MLALSRTARAGVIPCVRRGDVCYSLSFPHQCYRRAYRPAESTTVPHGLPGKETRYDTYNFANRFRLCNDDKPLGRDVSCGLNGLRQQKKMGTLPAPLCFYGSQ